MLQLHYAPSTAAMAPHILLEEIGLPFELLRVDTSAGAHKAPAYLALNPNGLVPVLTDGDLVLFESAAICLHLCDSHPAAGLAPAVGTVERAAALAGFVQSLGAWFLAEQPFTPQEDDYLVYTYNRFQACRFGMDAVYVDPASGEHMPLREHIMRTIDQIAGHAAAHGASGALHLLRSEAHAGQNDARWLRERQREEQLLAEVSRQAAQRFRGTGA